MDDLKARLKDKALATKGKPTIYSDKHLQAVSLPVGGIGTGLIQINGKAERHIWQIANNFCQAYVPNSFFAIKTQSPKKPAIIKSLQTSSIGPFKKMDKLTFQGEYPFGWFDFHDKTLPVQATMETFNPLIPLNEKDSAIPCAIYNITVKNISKKPVEVSMLATQLNIAGFEDIQRPDSPPTGKLFADLKQINETWQSQQDCFEDEGQTINATKLVSRSFTINNKYVHLLLGGCRKVDKACINLIIGGEKEFSATAKDKPVLEWYVWDVSKFKNKKAHFEILSRVKNESEKISVHKIFFSNDQLGLGLFKNPGKNCNAILTENNATILHMTTEKDKNLIGFGDMALAVLNKNVQSAARWESLEGLKKNWVKQNSIDGAKNAGTPSDNQAIDGALAVPFKLSPGKKQTITFILTWYFPNIIHGTDRGADNKPLPPQAHWRHKGNMYTNFWSSALDVAKYIIENFDRLNSQSHLYHDALYSSNLPHWLLDRISSQIVVLRSQTCFWSKDGYVGGWEGCDINSGSCYGNCSHVWHYAQSHARLFSSIAKRMREQSLRYEAENGALQFRQPLSKFANDGQCGEILEAYREHLTSSDSDWLKNNWPKIKKAMDFVISQWDSNEDGILAGSQHNTLDVDLGGSTSWIGTLYLASLQACEKMAKIAGDNETIARYNKIRAAGIKNQNDTLWNGEYYIQIPDNEARRDYNNGCHIDQILGEWWTNQLNLDPAYPLDRKLSAMKALLKYNFRTNFKGFEQKPRNLVAENDAGMLMITWPDNDRPENHILYADEVWPGTEYSAAATMIQLGMLKEGLMILKAVAGRFDGCLRTGLYGAEDGTQAWGYSGNPFCDEECGKFYARSMSVWSVLLACQGFTYDGPAAKIGFKPVWKPENHKSFFTAANGWGIFSQKQASKTQTETIELKYGNLTIKDLAFELPKSTHSAHVFVELNNQKIGATFKYNNNQIEIHLDEAVTIYAGQTLNIKISIAKQRQ